MNKDFKLKIAHTFLERIRSNRSTQINVCSSESEDVDFQNVRPGVSQVVQEVSQVVQEVSEVAPGISEVPPGIFEVAQKVSKVAQKLSQVAPAKEDSDEQARNLFEEQKEIVLRSQREQPVPLNETIINAPKRVSFSEGFRELIVLPGQTSKKWNDSVPNMKKGKFEETQKQKIFEAISSFLHINGMSVQDFVEIITEPEEKKSLRAQKLYAQLATLLPDRSPMSCYRFVQRNYHKYKCSGTWTPEQVDNLLSLVSRYGRSWARIARSMNRTSDDVYDKYRCLGEETMNDRIGQLWTLRELITYLKLIEEYSHKPFIDPNIEKELEKEAEHDNAERTQAKERKYNSKTFLFHNMEVVRNFVDGNVVQSIQTGKVPWSKIAVKLKTKSVYDCRNKFLQVLQVFYRNFRKSYDEEILDFIMKERVECESRINWLNWSSSSEITSEQARNRFRIMKRIVEGRARKPFPVVVKQLQERLRRQM